MEAPLLMLNQASPVPPYEQIRLQIQSLIASGRLVAGDFLPSVRQLGRDLGVAPNTVVRAYSELEQGHWITTVPRRGVMVAAHPPVMMPEERARNLGVAVHELLVKAHQMGASLEEIYQEVERQAGMLQFHARQ
ncbi:GntR family transcriptional regulator [Tengunoibacter tsumagoiensis]|uniref:HTH gntR-type domain-containing protein n=1 Tax=Tengunoibacter tsumagoiensis TaxID=2014871 RepID=A0A402A2Y1_9CHLR|nr:GntR family transcriptional regulator [Tengunoibacter tsumagoiensis]GCE13422.1 hypothetical protein KTT_32810 [Tengunoibacter tsumagoiensis]